MKHISTLIGLLLISCISTTTTVTPIKYRSQFRQDVYLHRMFFPKTRNGIVVEIGAFDGVKGSNTYYFEKALGWKGMCIEPLPSAFKKLQKNRSCICINGCVADFTGKAPLLVNDVLSGLKNKMNPQQKKRAHFTRKPIMVNCYLFNNLMRDHKIDHINYLSIDTEGCELDILKSINFDAITIDVLSVEGNYVKEAHAIRAFMATKDYILVRRLGVDDIFCRSGFFGITSTDDVPRLEHTRGLTPLTRTLQSHFLGRGK